MSGVYNISCFYYRIGAYDSVKQKYQEISGAKGGLNLLGVRIAAGQINQ